jgi:hypothetical protein
MQGMPSLRSNPAKLAPKARSLPGEIAVSEVSCTSSRTRRRPALAERRNNRTPDAAGYAKVVATLSLVFAMSSGTLAANRYPS